MLTLFNYLIRPLLRFYSAHAQSLNKPLAISTLLILSACSDPTNSGSNPNVQSQNHQNPSGKTIHIATTAGDFADFVRDYIGPELAKNGYPFTLAEISDGTIQNVSLNDGTLDINIFQHKPYLDEFNENYKTTLTPLVQVPTAPYGLYSGKIASLDQLKKGAKIGIPSNITNLARGLWILEQLGWIQLRADLPNRFRAITSDIASNPYQLQIVEIAGAQMVRARHDLDFAIINGNYAVDAGIPLTDALYIESSKHFINWAVVREDQVTAPWATLFTEIVNSAGFQKYIAENFAGYDLPLAWNKP
ncbi:hypothetical protein DC083_08805 [Ignatzschineria ureiclastica]|uniref:Methionine ABC transporter substrate-binding protein n=1 Tax=Ignatzschineria ureiclastica TaxID=472582 RepID=A0A2U2ACM1_9GAMM|nr:MetQ/NlpA family ABC transporter substrate-binding protein [Ignatzschineria ureiclastica]PWD80406.1 hypothetical protein DC083_08805 [Ignatzschineria ureiclastica]GGZ99725.1 lipoprotein [Ignatzschineria ureiclastica]